MIELESLRRVRAAVLTGCTFSVILSIVAAVGYAVRGQEIVNRTGLTLPHIVAGYFIGGILGGTLVGLLMPLARHKWGPPLLGFLGVLPFSVALTLSLFGRWGWFPPGLVISVIMALLLGAAPAAVVFNDGSKKRIDT